MSPHKIVSLVATLLITAVASSDVTSYSRPKNQDCLADVTASTVDLFPEPNRVHLDTNLIQVQEAEGFSVEYMTNYKVLKNMIANETYVLYQCGTSPPDPATFPDAKFFQIPLSSVATLDTTIYSFLELLGVVDRLYSVPSFVTAPCGQLLLSCNRTVDPMLDTTNETVVETTFAPHADAVFAVPFGQLSASPLVINVNAVADPGPLNRAEWVKFVAAFFNREMQANAIFNATVDQYTMLKERAVELPEKPVVAWITHYQYLEDESYQISFDAYKMQLVEDAGGANVAMSHISAIPGVQPSLSPSDLEFGWAANTSFASNEEALAAFIEALGQVDVVIDETYTATPADYTLDTFMTEYGLAGEETDLPFLVNDKVFRLDGLISEGGGLDWFESAVTKPDKVLRDVVRATHPELLANAGVYMWLRNIAGNETAVTMSPAACFNLQQDCDITPSPICPLVSVCKDGTVVNFKSNDGAVCEYEACSA